MFNLNFEYLFNTRPHSFEVWGTPILVTGIIGFIGAIVLKFIIPKAHVVYRSLLRKIKKCAGWYGIGIIILYLFRFERVPYLSMRIWLWMWIVILVVLSALFLFKEYKKIPQKKQKIEEESKKKRYFEQ